MYKTIITLFLFITTISQAQPGPGGGGLTIYQITDKYGNEINISKDPFFKIRIFDIVNDTVC